MTFIQRSAMPNYKSPQYVKSENMMRKLVKTPLLYDLSNSQDVILIAFCQSLNKHSYLKQNNLAVRLLFDFLKFYFRSVYSHQNNNIIGLCFP